LNQIDDILGLIKQMNQDYYFYCEIMKL